MFEQEEHEVRLVNSGSWSVDYTIEDGEIEASSRYSFHVELMGEAECSCGQTFYDEGEVIQHLRQQEQNGE
jgi:hypothetical protein